MKVRILMLAATLLLAAGVGVVAPAERAEAHNFDNYSTWFCAAHRPTNYVLVHSWPYMMQPGLVGYWCEAGFYGYNVQYWVHWDQDTGHSWRPWAYQSCKPQGITWCGTAGH